MTGESSERQWNDVLGILKVQHGRLNEAHCSEWATAIGVADLWNVREALRLPDPTHTFAS